MRTLTGVAITLTLGILTYVLWRPTLRYVFHHNEHVPTPDGWTPKMRTRKNGVWTNEPWGAAIR